MSNPIVTTDRQEREMGGGGVMWYRALKSAKCRTALWRLKQTKPELFAQTGEKEEEDVPPGFKPSGEPGWFYNADRRAYYHSSTERLCWLDEVTGERRDLNEGDTWTVGFVGGAAVSLGKSSPSSSSSSSAPGAAGTSQKSVPKQVQIPDLHKAADALRIDLGHLDKPASLVAIFAAGESGSIPPEVAARGFHEKLLKRLAADRGEWSDQALSAALAGAFSDLVLAAGSSALRPAAAVMLAVGRRIAAAAATGARFVMSPQRRTRSTKGTADVGFVLGSPATASDDTATACLGLQEDLAEHVNVVLLAGEGAGDPTFQAAVEAAVSSFALCEGRPRTASIALLQATLRPGIPMVAACGRLSPLPKGHEDKLPPAKKPRIGELGAKETGQLVRVRQILLRHMSAGRGLDPVTRKPVKRTLEEAEAQMLHIREELEKEKCANFPALCRAHSECASKLKGGDLAGDVGWLDQATGAVAEQSKGIKAVKAELPPAVQRAAFELQVGDLGDILSSDIGVHLLQRAA